MMTLDLKKSFAELACADHLQRVRAVMTELDSAYGYSMQADFKEVIAGYISQLEARGLFSAYQQSCVLFCALSKIIEIAALPHIKNSAGLHRYCVQQALNCGVSSGVFEHMHRQFSGVAHFNEAWLDPKGEPALLGAAASLLGLPTKLRIACGHDGPLMTHTDSTPQLLPGSAANFFRSDHGFQHRVFGKFTPLELLKQVCQFSMPRSKSVFSLHPLVASCELGDLTHNQFEQLQEIEVMDARQFQINLDKYSLRFSENDLDQLRSNWRSSVSLSETLIQIREPTITFDLNMNAGWATESHGTEGEIFNFKVQGHVCLEISPHALQWQASLVHEGVLVHLGVQPSQNLRIEWDLSQAHSQGQLPVDQPFIQYEQKVPLTVNCSSVIGVGQAVLSPPTGPVGYLMISLIGRVNSDSRHFELHLVLSHSEMNCDWQFADPLLGWSRGSWSLLPQSIVARWNLLHG